MSRKNEIEGTIDLIHRMCCAVHIAIATDGEQVVFLDTETGKRYTVKGAEKLQRQEQKQLNDAKEVIRKLLCAEYGSSCSFCVHDENPDAKCALVAGSGSWCCENAEWNGRTEG